MYEPYMVWNFFQNPRSCMAMTHLRGCAFQQLTHVAKLLLRSCVALLDVLASFALLNRGWRGTFARARARSFSILIYDIVAKQGDSLCVAVPVSALEAWI